MASIGSIRPSLLHASNENALALANLKFDFSLAKVEAPIEYRGLGLALSLGRRHSAELGAPHKTARKLGALFEQLTPSTPSLITAYGKRVSSIIKTPGLNPTGSSSHGPFEAFVGVEGTALWAAATSGVPALGIYLLACMLARAWDAKASTAIWVEIVEGRKSEIEEAIQRNDIVSEITLYAASQEISRQELRRWDDNPRAWLRTADEAMERKQKQLMLILHNVSIPFNGGPSTYAKVIEAWKEAMRGMESLLRGQPQMITTGSALLALSAWHLYPDLVVLGQKPTPVIFRDDLIPTLGVGTIGVQSSDTKSPQWSLALSHIQYYGGPVNVESTKDSSRVNIDQLYIVVLGSLFYSWRLKVSELKAATRWFHGFWETLQQVDSEDLSYEFRKFDWLLHLANAAGTVTESFDGKDDVPFALLKYGHRRAKTFLSPVRSTPFFGLWNLCIIVGLSKELDIESGIAYLRRLAQELNLKETEGIIRYTLGEGSTHEYATAVPHLRGDGAVGALHARWLVLRPPSGDDSLSETTYLRERSSAIAQMGECGLLITDPLSVITTYSMGALTLQRPPLLYLYSYGSSVDGPGCTSTGLGKDACPCLAAVSDTAQDSLGLKGEQYSEFRLVVGSWNLGLYVHTGSDEISRRDINRQIQSVLSTPVERRRQTPDGQPLDDKLAQFPTDVHWDRLLDYMCAITSLKSSSLSLEDLNGLGAKLLAWEFLHTNTSSNKDVLKSLHAMALVYNVYHRLEGATISLKIMNQPILKASWIPEMVGDFALHPNDEVNATPRNPLFRPVDMLEPFSRPKTLACIAYLESGGLDIDSEGLAETLAVCSENSIYVVGVVLADPFERIDPSDVRRIVGNSGRTGISMLVAPEKPRIRSLNDTFNIVNHEEYDLKREDNFQGTSLHLSFTDWTLPLETHSTHTIDSDVSFVEAVISVRDRGEWVADLDILAIDFQELRRHSNNEYCFHEDGLSIKTIDTPVISLDSWEELLDRPREGIGVFRANGNWAARLAALSILTQQGFAKTTMVTGSDTDNCIRCIDLSLSVASLERKVKLDDQGTESRNTRIQRSVEYRSSLHAVSDAFCIA